MGAGGAGFPTHVKLASHADTVLMKAARVTLFPIHVAMALVGKGLVLMTGTVADVRAGVQAAAEQARKRGLLVSEVVIPRPDQALFSEYL